MYFIIQRAAQRTHFLLCENEKNFKTTFRKNARALIFHCRRYNVIAGNVEGVVASRADEGEHHRMMCFIKYIIICRFFGVHT